MALLITVTTASHEVCSSYGALKMLILDAIINLILGFLLLAFPLDVFQLLGLPVEAPPFYASILGAVLVGIGVALLTEQYRGPGRSVGLGLAGAIIINLYAALVLAALLVSGKLSIPFRGYMVLWGVVILLLIISAFEIAAYRKKEDAHVNPDHV
jgi:hypothetical protein